MDHFIRPSKFYFVNRDTSLKECMQLMQDKKLSFLLVEDASGQLEGIFTLKDLLKIFEYVAYGSHMAKPVSVAMSRPVKTIASTQLHKAAEIMLDEGVRHLPVVSADGDDSERVVGVVDMESILRGEVDYEKKQQLKSKDIAVFSPNGALINFMKSVLQPYPRLSIDKMWASKLVDREHMEAYVQNYDLFFLDIVDRKALHFAETFAQEVDKAKKRMVGMVSTEQFSNKEDLTTINKIIKLERVRIFEKPITMHDVVYECLY